MVFFKNVPYIFFLFIFIGGTGLANDQLSVEFPDTVAMPDDILTLSIMVGDITPFQVVSYQFNIQYNPEVISITGVSKNNTISKDLLVTFNPNFAPGKVRVTTAGATGLTGSGVLLYFTVQAEEIGDSGIEWDEVFFYDSDGNAVDLSTTDGNVSVLVEPSTPELESPADGISGTPVTVDMSWNQAYLAYTYSLQISTTSEFSGLLTVIDGIEDTTYTIADLQHDTEYFWRVRSVNRIGISPWSDYRSFTTIVAVPDEPVLSAPDDGAVNVAIPVSLSWQNAARAEQYRVQIAGIDSFEPLFLDSVITATSIAIGSMENSTTYYWRVRAYNDGGNSDWSGIRSFTTVVELPDAVTLLSPEDNTVYNTDTVTVVWSSNPAAENYHLQIAEDENFTLVVYNNESIGDTTFTVAALQPNKTYWWRVRAQNAAGWGEYSQSRSFTITITSVDISHGIPVVFELHQNYPNPFNPATTIRYAVPVQSQIRIDIFNSLGQLVTRLIDGEHMPGFYEVQWYADGSSGTYFYRIEGISTTDKSVQFVQTKNMLLVR